MNDDIPRIVAAKHLRTQVSQLSFDPPVEFVYNPLEYAWDVFAAYVQKYGAGRKKVVFLGMNPGPFGMAQTGVPFGEIAAVRDWMRLRGHIGKPLREHPKRPIQGLACPRSEVSGRRLWGLFAKRFGSPEVFFTDHFVANYCPLVFMTATGANLTPDKLRPSDVIRLYARCDEYLRQTIESLQPDWVVGIGGFAVDRASAALDGYPVHIVRVLHPSPASPAANKDWAGQVVRTLITAGIWRSDPGEDNSVVS